MPDGPRRDALIGSFRRFGESGPVYRILGKQEELPDGEVMLRVQVVETGEEASYRLSRAIEDPVAI